LPTADSEVSIGAVGRSERLIESAIKLSASGRLDRRFALSVYRFGVEVGAISLASTSPEYAISRDETEKPSRR